MTNWFGIYVHIPFCVHKCSYCDFYSFTKFDRADFERFTDRLIEEIRQAAAWLERRDYNEPVRSIFFGGGTPSLLPVDLHQRIGEAISEAFAISKDAEITMEANPETVTENLCKEIRAKTFFNRISLGAQSFSAKHLSQLERLGSAQSIRNASQLLRDHGFTNFSLDLIFGIPGQGEKGMLRDIEEATALQPKHISFYNLTLKPGHALYEKLPSDDRSAVLYENGIAALGAAGFQQYEISNFAKPDFESKHNLLYWDGGDFLGVGPSASSRFFWDGTFHHRKQSADFGKYLSSATFPDPGFESTNHEQSILEATFLEMRKNSGVNVKQFTERYGYCLTQAKKFPLFCQEGLLNYDGNSIRFTPRGRLLADTVTRDLVD